MIKLGIVGFNEGNGHPYSYASVFNGFHPEKLSELCPFSLIKVYLPEHHRQQTLIPQARVTHIWTQARNISQNIATVANIPNVVEHLTDMIGQVDAVLFCRDDIENHYAMALPLLAAKIPVYMDKVMAHDAAALSAFVAATGETYPIMTASSFRFSPAISAAKAEFDLRQLRSICAVSPNVWLRYSPHLLDPLLELAGRVKRVRAIGCSQSTFALLEHEIEVVSSLQVTKDLSLPIELNLFGNSPQKPRRILYTDESLHDYFFSIVAMMREFIRRLEHNDFSAAEFQRSVHLNEIVLSVQQSRQQNGNAVDL